MSSQVTFSGVNRFDEKITPLNNSLSVYLLCIISLIIHYFICISFCFHPVVFPKMLIIFRVYVVRYRNPNQPSPVDVQWPAFNTDTRRHLYVTSQGFEDKLFTLSVKSVEYWDTVYGLREENAKHDEL